MNAGAARALGYMRSAILAIWMFATAIALGLLCLPLLLGPRRLAMAPIRWWAQALMLAMRPIVGIAVEVRGRERLPAGGCLIAAKHQSMLDTLVAMTLTPWPAIILKKELMRIPIFGWYAWKSGMIPIDRSGGGGEVRGMLKAAARAVGEGRPVLLYPEGTRRPPGATPDYKGGVGLIYAELGAPCAPLACNSGLVWPAHGLLKRPGAAVFEVLEPIPAGLSRRALMRELQAALEARSDALLTEGRGGS